MSRNLDIASLRAFAVVAETGALTRATRRLHRTQSALSMQMQRLEASVGQPLLVRGGRGVQLTAAGERLVVHARRLLRLHDEALADVSGQGLTGELRFGCPDDYAAVFLPPLLRGFAWRHPEVQVEVMCATTPALRRELAARTLDLALVSVAPDDADAIRREPLVWVGGPGLDLAADPLPLALSPPETLDHRAARTALEACGRRYRVAYASSSLAGLAAVVRSGQAATVLTQTAVPPDLAALPPGAGLPPLPTLGIAVQVAGAVPSAAAAAFARHVAEMLPTL